MDILEKSLNAPGDDPIAALRQLVLILEAKGHSCYPSIVVAAADELDELRARAVRNRPMLGETALIVLREIHERSWDLESGFASCAYCFGIREECFDRMTAEEKLCGHEVRGHVPGCSLARVLEAARFGK